MKIILYVITTDKDEFDKINGGFLLVSLFDNSGYFKCHWFTMGNYHYIFKIIFKARQKKFDS